MNLIQTALGIKTNEERIAWWNSLSLEEQEQFRSEFQEYLKPLQESAQKIVDGAMVAAAALRPIFMQIQAAAEEAAMALAAWFTQFQNSLPPGWLKAFADDPQAVERYLRHERHKASYERRYARGGQRRRDQKRRK